MWWYVAVISAAQEAEAGGTEIQDQPRQSQEDHVSKIKNKIKG
jgi:hypothetical protein